MEKFILRAVELYTEHPNNVDKFELLLRRFVAKETNETKLATVGIGFPIPASATSILIEKMTPELADELSKVDITSMSDEEIVEYARRVGLMS